VEDETLCFTTDVYFLSFFISLGDRRETLPRDYYIAEFYNANPKVWGSPLKWGGAKHAKFG